MAKTLAEKILSNHSGRDLKAGDYAICKIDFAFSQDGTSILIIDHIKKMKLKKLKTDFCMVIDHNAPSANRMISRIHKKMRDFSRQYDTSLYDVGCGICHQVIPESGHILPGDLVLGADSHTSTYGALSALATGVGSTDVSISLATGRNWFKVPETFKIILRGEIPKGVFAKDIVLRIIANLKSDGATYKAVEFDGSVIRNIDMDGRFTICNMVVEMGAKCGFIPVDKKTIDWLRLRLPHKRKLNPISPDKHAKYLRVLEYDVSHLSPLVALPHRVDNVIAVKRVRNLKIDQAFLGTCTNARLQDLKIAAKILKGKKVARGIKFIIVPSSRYVMQEAVRMGLIETFIKAGAVVLSPGCGPCVGTHNGIPADGEVVISSANRNFKGRMGNPKARIFLASPATVTASAIEGRIADPCKYLN